MHLKKYIKDDRGFTLVELIIVIAIIAIMSGIGFATMSMMNSAKAKEAGVTLNAEISDMIKKSTSQLCVVPGVDEKVTAKYRNCLMVYEDTDGKYYLKRGFYNSAGTTDADKYLFDAVDNGKDQKGVSLSSRVELKYTDSANKTYKIDTSGASDSVKQVYIIFNNDGTIKNGVGTYSICKTGGTEVSSLILRKNGSHKLD